MNNQEKTTVLYVFDPLCGWCYGFSPVMVKLNDNYKENVKFVVISGGMVVGDRIGPLGEKAGNPMNDPRALVREGDVAAIIRERAEAYDTILLDTDNGPEGLTQDDNRKIYSEAGVRAIHACLRTGGVLAVWSTHPDKPFSRRLGMAGFKVEEVQVPATGTKGTKHTLWFAKKLPPQQKGPPKRR